MLCLVTLKALAYTWTDANGVTWTFSQKSYTINGASQQLWTITAASDYGLDVTVPQTVYNGSTACTVEAITGPSFPSASNVTLPATMKYIEYDVFGTSRNGNMYGGTVTLNATTPPTLKAYSSSKTDVFGAGVTVLVPASSLTAYRTAEVWKDMDVRIISQSAKTTYSISTSALASASGIHQAIGEENLGNVMSLTVTGSINSYDIMIMRNKMYNLHHLDLTNANIVANSYPYYENYSTTDNVLGDRAFYVMQKLMTVKLPNTMTAIGDATFSGCHSLTSVSMPACQTIGGSAFNYCDALTSVSMPVCQSIDNYAFRQCYALTNVSLPACKTIGGSAFLACSALTSVSLPVCQSIDNDAFRQCYALTNVSLPACQTIGSEAFGSCFALTSVSLPACQSIDGYAFGSCSALTNVSMPVCQSIGGSAFEACSALTSVSLPVCQSIGGGAFGSCSALTNVSMPVCQTIGKEVFIYCTSLAELHIPSSITSIGDGAFSGCTALKDYYAYTIEPTSIAESTFSNWTTATLHVPMHAYYNYYYDTQWSKFAKLVQETDYQYEYFYLTQDYTFNDAVGAMSSTPDVNLNAGSGLIVETTNETVNLDNVHVAYNGTNAASIIANNNLSVGTLFFDIEVTKNKWYFMTFPFRVKLQNVTSPGDFVFRYYDGQQRATNGSTGWKNVTDTYLQAGQGYIFQTNTTGTLTLKVEKADLDFSGSARQDALSTYTAANTANASWNFIGNPHSSYFDLEQTGYTAPVTVWTGSAYQAVRPGDDSYFLQPFQAFFVQKPNDVATMDFPAAGRYTYNQMTERQQSASAPRRQASPTGGRRLVNLTIGNGEEPSDRTRVVFNEAKSTAYEMDCDAAKFFSESASAQLYSVDHDGTTYAINERPQGEVTLGYVAAASGDLTINAERTDCGVLLRDNVLNIVHDFSTGGYTFTTEAGTDESRFTLVFNGDVTGIGSAPSVDGKPVVRTDYTLEGVKLSESSQYRGVRIVKEGNKVRKVVR